MTPHSVLDTLLERCRQEPATKDVLARLAAGEKLLPVGGLAGSLNQVFQAVLAEGRQTLLLVDDLNEADALRDDLALLLGKDKVFLLPPRELMPYDRKSLPLDKRSELMEIMRKLRFGEPIFLLANLRSLCEKFPAAKVLDRGIHQLETGMSLDRDEFLESLVEAGFRRESAVEDIAQFSVRGGILDLYPWGIEFPIRIEFFGDEIESIRAFDPDTQVSNRPLSSVTLITSAGTESHDVPLSDLLRPDALVIQLPRALMKDHLDFFHREAQHNWDTLGSGQDGEWPPELKYLRPAEVLNSLVSFQRVELHPAAVAEGINFSSRQQESFQRNVKLLVESLQELHGEGYALYLLCDNNGQRERMEELLEECGLAAGIVKVSIGSLREGYVSRDSRTAVFTDHQVFNRPKARRNPRRFRRATMLRKIDNLEPGDFVVHIRFGIGQFEGLTRITVNEVEREVLKIRYHGDNWVFVKLENFKDVEKYSAQEGFEPVLNKLGTGDWERAKKKTRKDIQKIAQELVELYARRKMSRGHSFAADTVWQREMEAAFEYEETSDQLKAIADTKKDMEQGFPMDRLICGDVGFGKTEVAVRAVFKAVADGKQAAVLVPTTILAQQHFQTFSNRFAEFPAQVEVLSRFRTRKEIDAALANVAAGRTDVVIGTHRLLSKDVVFKDLGLLVVDEEQRFGVKHKERIKQLRANLDVLTLTATPIPRTLDMAMLGIKDLSLVNVPPANRLPIETEIVAFNKTTIRNAIMRELDRDGQVYFVHNRVQSIDTMRAMLEDLLPEVRFCVGHGQMPDGQLEKVMLDFMHRRYDVLISTMIIESGLDIPNVNTMIVSRADTFGLAQLYQLRGRIGRSHRQAYAYLLTPPAFDMTPVAKKRLYTIGELTDLGSGFKIAMRDLEIRGAGNILGKEQSGHIATVGYELYNKLLEEAILELKHQEQAVAPERFETRVDLPFNALLPESYIEDPGERMNQYRRLLNARDSEELHVLRSEMRDRFGSMPQDAVMLFHLVEIQKLGQAAQIARVEFTNRRLVLHPFTKDGDEAAAGRRLVSQLQHLGPEWPVELESTPSLRIALSQKNTEMSVRIDQTRALLKELTMALEKVSAAV
ncbi:MAG: transcription-repair coupling factor [Candidatus Cloacimonetes bacterium]|nr:transcription-repair coupling factor [Candidatus Cloacimonadota bacterium]